MNSFIKSLVYLLIIFVVMEGFYLLPASVVIPFPGVFRLSDISIFIIAAFLLLKPVKCLNTAKKTPQIALLIIFMCFLTILTAIMADFFFGQRILTGLVAVRHSFNYLLFFPLLLFFRTGQDLRTFIKTTVYFLAVIMLLSILQRMFPMTHIFQLYSIGTEFYTQERFIRLGQYRLFFPHISFTALFFCLILSDLLFNRSKGRILKVCFVGLFYFIVFENLTRSHILSISVVTLVALMFSGRRILKAVSLVLTLLIVLTQLLSIAVTESGISYLEESRFFRIFALSVNVNESSIEGRVFQNKMYFANFLRSPVVGVGSLKFSENFYSAYKRYGFFNNNDLGYSKMLAEYGLVGILWVLLFFRYVYRRTKTALQAVRGKEEMRYFRSIIVGVRLFYVYILISGITIPHFVEGIRIVPIVLSVVFLEFSLRLLRSAQASSSVSVS